MVIRSRLSLRSAPVRDIALLSTFAAVILVAPVAHADDAPAAPDASKMDDEQIIARQAPTTRACVNRARTAIGSVAGRAAINVVVDSRGNVARVEVKENSGLPAMALDCIAGSYARVTSFRGNNVSERAVAVPVAVIQQR